jgi:hypothetical protein
MIRRSFVRAAGTSLHAKVCGVAVLSWSVNFVHMNSVTTNI